MTITWFGHCCFLLDFNDSIILTDPYDDFLGIAVGKIPADMMTISSIWHDHGNIATSPQSHIYAYEGTDEKKGITITGIKSKESRGSSNIIFNIVYGNLSITNFADWGEPASIELFTKEEMSVFEKTNIAFVRANAIDDSETQFFYDLALKVCHPELLIPCHYYPKSFIERSLPPNQRQGYSRKITQIEKMIKRGDFKRLEIHGYKFTPDMKNTEVLRPRILVQEEEI